jgi:hypothetical protein
MIALLLAACGTQQGTVEDDESALELRVVLDGVPAKGGGAVIVQAEYDPDGEITLPDPVVDRLTFEADGPALHERLGDRDVVTQRYVFRGPKGSYEIPPLTAKWTGEGGEVEAKSTAVFVDLDVPPPREGEIEDIVEPAPLRRIPWRPIAVVTALFAGGLFLAFRPRRRSEIVAEPPPPPDVLALRQWVRVRDDASLTIDDKAREVARIFREYIEAVLGFEATSRTTFELLEHLGSLRHLPEGNVPRARRMLRAADRVKFAEERPAGGWVEELDSDLRAFVESTRPSAWKASDRSASSAPQSREGP